MNFHPDDHFLNRGHVRRTHAYLVEFWTEVYWDGQEDQDYLATVAHFRGKKFCLDLHKITKEQATLSNDMDDAFMRLVRYGDPNPEDEDEQVEQSDG